MTQAAVCPRVHPAAKERAAQALPVYLLVTVVLVTPTVPVAEETLIVAVESAPVGYVVARRVGLMVTLVSTGMTAALASAILTNSLAIRSRNLLEETARTFQKRASWCKMF
jgi:hypothetical protein